MILMKRIEIRIPYDAPEAWSFELEPTDALCGTSPNHPGDDLPWYPGHDEEDEF